MWVIKENEIVFNLTDFDDIADGDEEVNVVEIGDPWLYKEDFQLFLVPARFSDFGPTHRAHFGF